MSGTQILNTVCQHLEIILLQNSRKILWDEMVGTFKLLLPNGSLNKQNYMQRVRKGILTRFSLAEFHPDGELTWQGLQLLPSFPAHQHPGRLPPIFSIQHLPA